MKIFIPILLIFSSCGHTRFRHPATPSIKEKIIRPGEVVYLVFNQKPVKNGRLACRGKTFAHHYDGEQFSAYISETYFSKRKPYSCTYGNKTGQKVVAHFQVKDKDFPIEYLKMDRKKVILSVKNQKRVRREQAFLNKIYKNSSPLPLFKRPFALPIDSSVTSIYGVRRVLNNIRKSQHLGTDFRAAVGTPIFASNSGKVVVSRSLFYTGKTVIIDHGMDIFTVYGHLSRTEVAEGEDISLGDVVGLSGKTGRVTGPHLHWGVKIAGSYIDGHQLIKITRNSL